MDYTIQGRKRQRKIAPREIVDYNSLWDMIGHRECRGDRDPEAAFPGTGAGESDGRTGSG